MIPSDVVIKPGTSLASTSWFKRRIAPRVTIDLVIESVELPNHFFHNTEPSEIQSKFLMRDEWTRFYYFKELLSSTLCS